MLNLAHYYAYDAGDKDVKTLVFTPEKILSYDAQMKPKFMKAMCMYFENTKRNFLCIVHYDYT